MFISAALLTAFLSLFNGADANQYPDELIATLVRAAKEHEAIVRPQIRAAPAVAAAPGLRSILKDKPSPKPKPDPKPKPGPYMVFSNHIDDLTCGEPSMIESHGYVIGNCFVGTGDLAGLYWSFTYTSDADNIFLNYGFYTDDQCQTTPTFASVETLTNGCVNRGTAGGHGRSKRFFYSPTIPNYRHGTLFNGYETASDCMTHKPEDIVDWSYVSNGQCNPDINSPIYGSHTDETRSCTPGPKGGIVGKLYSSDDLSCSGTVLTTTNIGPEWNCRSGSNSGAGAVFLQPTCV